MREHLGRYRLVEELGRGGMGIVYRAVDDTIGRTVAIKTILLEEAAAGAQIHDLQERLKREVLAAGRLQHPNIVTIHDFGIDDGTAYVVMEFIEGRSLEKALQDGLLPVEESLRIVRETARALDHAHSRDVIHRDIEPANVHANVLIDTKGTVKLADFGIAKVAGTKQ
jgi:serine/threonine-protein kinase